MSGAAGFISSIFCAASSTPAHGSSPSDMTDILPTSTVSSPTKSSSTSTTAPERHRNSKKIQEISTLRDPETLGSACCGMKLAPSGRYLYASTAGENTVAVFRVDQETGMLTRICCLPISGEYPKDIDIFPGEKTLVVLNHESNEIRFFTVDYEKGLLVMKGRPIKVDTPNCILISKIGCC